MKYINLIQDALVIISFIGLIIFGSASYNIGILYLMQMGLYSGTGFIAAALIIWMLAASMLLITFAKGRYDDKKV